MLSSGDLIYTQWIYSLGQGLKLWAHSLICRLRGFAALLSLLFKLRPALASWYCRYLRLSVRPCLCTRSAKTPWLGSLLLRGWGSIDFGVKLILKRQNLPYLSLSMVHSPRVQACSRFPNLDQKYILAFVKIPFDVGLHWSLAFHSATVSWSDHFGWYIYLAVVVQSFF